MTLGCCPSIVIQQHKGSICLKDLLVAYPDFSKCFDIYTDNPKFQLGAVIILNNMPLAFFTRKLSPEQQKYSMTEQELPAIVETVTEFKGML